MSSILKLSQLSSVAQNFLQVRRIATSSRLDGLIQAPIQIFGRDGRYAHALYSAASRQKKLDEVDKELNIIQSALKSSPRVLEFLRDPTVHRKEKITALRKVVGDHINPITQNFLEAVAENGRMKQLPSFVTAFGRLMAATRGEVTATVTSARPLEPSQLEEVRNALQRMVGKGRKLNIESKVDPDLLGGLVVAIGDRFVDLSVATRVRTYSNIIRESLA